MKEQYETPAMDVINLDSEDVIITSIGSLDGGEASVNENG